MHFPVDVVMLPYLLRIVVACLLLTTLVFAQASSSFELSDATAPVACSATCKGTTSDGVQFDLSALQGLEFQTAGSDQNVDTYFFNVCGTSNHTCPSDAGDPPVTQGTAVQTFADGGCYVLGQYTGNNCKWSANPGGAIKEFSSCWTMAATICAATDLQDK